MTPVFADAYYFFAILSPKDEAHRSVTAFNATLRRPIVTSAWVLTEVGDGLAATPSRRLFGTLLQRLRSDVRVTIVPPTPRRVKDEHRTRHLGTLSLSSYEALAT